jgi:hypothetical protein
MYNKKHYSRHLKENKYCTFITQVHSKCPEETNALDLREKLKQEWTKHFRQNMNVQNIKHSPLNEVEYIHMEINQIITYREGIEDCVSRREHEEATLANKPIQ